MDNDRKGLPVQLIGIENILEANAITHGGVFHADDVLATAILDLAHDDLKVCRVADAPENTPHGVIVYDIGGGPYDHHQRGGNGVRDNGIPYAAAGLVWRDFGMRVVCASCNPLEAWRRIDRSLVQGIDAADNGLVYDNGETGQLTLPQIIKLMNPVMVCSQKPYDEAFCKAVRFARNVLSDMLAHVEAELCCSPVVENAIENSVDHVLELPCYMPWKEPFFTSRNPLARDLYYVAYPALRSGYCWRCIPKSIDDNASRMPVPKSWWGLNGADLQTATGVRDAIFCHSAGFLGLARSREGLYEMLRNAMKERK